MDLFMNFSVKLSRSDMTLEKVDDVNFKNRTVLRAISDPVSDIRFETEIRDEHVEIERISRQSRSRICKSRPSVGKKKHRSTDIDA